MKRTILLSLIIALFSIHCYSQQEKETKSFYFGGGIGIGFFYPTEINDAIGDYYSNTQQEYGTYDMIMYYALKAQGSYFFSRYTELQMDLEWAFSPKLIIIDDVSDTWFFRRITPALKFNFHIPVSDKFSIFVGPGISWNNMRLNTPIDVDFKATTIGFSAQTGIMLRFRKWAIAPNITANFINTDKSETIGDYNGSSDLNLNYTGVQIGNTFFF